MNIKQSVGIIALAVASSSSQALIHPGNGRVVSKTYCLQEYEDVYGSKILGTCDESNNNILLEKTIFTNGCAENQSGLKTYKGQFEREFPIKINSCLPPNVSQL